MVSLFHAPTGRAAVKCGVRRAGDHPRNWVTAFLYRRPLHRSDALKGPSCYTLNTVSGLFYGRGLAQTTASSAFTGEPFSAARLLKSPEPQGRFKRPCSRGEAGALNRVREHGPQE